VIIKINNVCKIIDTASVHRLNKTQQIQMKTYKKQDKIKRKIAE